MPLPFRPLPDTPEGWLSQYDRNPRIIPEWPVTPSLAVVMVCPMRSETGQVDTTALVLLSEEELRRASRHTELAVLYFTVPRQALLESGLCEGLREDSFADKGT